MGNGSGEEPVGRPEPPSGQPPADPASLLQQRQAARERRDFATADAIRDQLRQAGWLVRDTPDGPELTEAPPYQTLDPAALRPAVGRARPVRRLGGRPRHRLARGRGQGDQVAGRPPPPPRLRGAAGLRRGRPGDRPGPGGPGRRGPAPPGPAPRPGDRLRRLHEPRHGPGARPGAGLARPARRGHRRPARPAAGRPRPAGHRAGRRLGGDHHHDARVRGRRRPRGRRHRGLPAGRAAGAGGQGSGSTPRTATTATPTSTTPSPSAPSGLPGPSGPSGSRCPRPGTGTAGSTRPTPQNGTARPERTTIGSSDAGRIAPTCSPGGSGAITGTGNRRAGFGV